MVEVEEALEAAPGIASSAPAVFLIHLLFVLVTSLPFYVQETRRDEGAFSWAPEDPRTAYLASELCAVLLALAAIAAANTHVPHCFHCLRLSLPRVEVAWALAVAAAIVLHSPAMLAAQRLPEGAATSAALIHRAGVVALAGGLILQVRCRVFAPVLAASGAVLTASTLASARDDAAPTLLPASILLLGATLASACWATHLRERRRAELQEGEGLVWAIRVRRPKAKEPEEEEPHKSERSEKEEEWLPVTVPQGYRSPTPRSAWTSSEQCDLPVCTVSTQPAFADCPRMDSVMRSSFTEDSYVSYSLSADPTTPEDELFHEVSEGAATSTRTEMCDVAVETTFTWDQDAFRCRCCALPPRLPSIPGEVVETHRSWRMPTQCSTTSSTHTSSTSQTPIGNLDGLWELTYNEETANVVEWLYAFVVCGEHVWDNEGNHRLLRPDERGRVQLAGGLLMLEGDELLRRRLSGAWLRYKRRRGRRNGFHRAS